jgi:Transmembrane exosortase (Exosortase_EpsH)
VRYRNLLALPVIAWLYAPVLARLFAVWMYSPFFSHGIFVPAFAALVLWRDRKKLKAIEAAHHGLVFRWLGWHFSRGIPQF